MGEYACAICEELTCEGCYIKRKVMDKETERYKKELKLRDEEVK